jgi:3-phosphoshikimate 1-carboxyvinyltransferase
MALPELIEIVPLDKPVRAEITVPGSKSITNRALILAAFDNHQQVTLSHALWSEDTQIMCDCLKKLGFEIRYEMDPKEFCNRIIWIKGLSGKIPNGGTAEKPLELFVGNAGTAARFLSAFVCLGNGTYRLSGVARMHERPQAALFSALRKLGYRVESEKGNDKLPVKIYGEGPKKGECRVSIEESSQFASALLLCEKIGGWKIEIIGENAEESPYVELTKQMCSVFEKIRGEINPSLLWDYPVDPDASGASYFWGARFLLNNYSEPINYRITTPPWTHPKLQIDTEFAARILLRENSRLHDLGDSIMTAITLAPTMPEVSKFFDLGRLRLQETERVVALRTELTKCGAKVVEEGDTLTVWPSPLHGAEIETYNDHRMAMCFAILGLKVPGIKIKNPACVKKTFPNFFQKVAGPPPNGLGAEIWEIKNGQRTRKLSGDDLFAD